MILLNIKFVNYTYEESLKQYTNYISSNNFSNLMCTNCKVIGNVQRNTEYVRNYIYIENEKDITETTIVITVVRCNNCGKYHALLPAFIFPYHIYSACFIMYALNMKLIKQQQAIKLISYLNISGQLLYYWIKVFNKFVSSSTIVLPQSPSKDPPKILHSILNDLQKFISDYYSKLFIMFFLNRKNHLFK